MIVRTGKINLVNVVLFFSLALNFFIAGYLLSDTRMVKNLHDRKILHKRPEVRMVDYFPKKERRKFRHFMHKQHKEIMPFQRDVISKQKEIFQVISEKEIDEVQLRQAFKKYQGSSDLLQTAINDVVIEMVLDMDYETRLEIIHRGKRAHERRKKMRKRWQAERMKHNGERWPLPKSENEYGNGAEYNPN
ncbi:MAG: periplasmic heavy metal sensor [Emcibacter sp.]|nr:periplasmic heavy metal sensor [Emcibacter sp.]